MSLMFILTFIFMYTSLEQIDKNNARASEKPIETKTIEVKTDKNSSYMNDHKKKINELNFTGEKK